MTHRTEQGADAVAAGELLDEAEGPVGAAQSEGREGIAAVGAGTDPAGWLGSSPNKNAAKVFLNWILSRDGQSQFQKLTRENSLRVDIPKEAIVNPYYILDPKKEYLFTGLEEHKDKINEFRPWLETLVGKK